MSHQLSIAVLSGVSGGDVFHFELDPGQTVRIGRDPAADVLLADASVSRRHAEIRCDERGFAIMDCGSSHGTLHMGFQLKAGPEGARPLSPHDEFRIGETTFRVDFDPASFRSPAQPAKAQSKPAAKTRTGRLPMLLGLFVVGLVVLGFLLMSGGGPSKPKQSEAVLNFPQYRVIGNLVAGKKATQSDRSHPKQAAFLLPAADVLVEFEFLGEGAIDVLVGDVEIDEIAPNRGSWERRVLIVRDPFIGAERQLIFRNSTAGRLPRWAIRNVRVLPLARSVEGDMRRVLDGLVALGSAYDKSSRGLFLLVRGLQNALVDALNAAALDGIGYAVPLDSTIPSVAQMEQSLEGLKTAAGDSAAVVLPESFVRELAQLASVFDAELWRRANSRLNSARNAARVKNYIVAHDELIEAKEMFGDEADYRWVQADKLFRTNSIVPPKVRARPEKFRKALLKGR